MRWPWCVMGFVAMGCGGSGNAPLDSLIADEKTTDASHLDASGSDGPCTVTLSAGPSPLRFGNITAGQASTPGVVVVANDGDCASTPIVETLGGSDPSEFAIAASTCAGHPLVPGTPCTVAIEYRPSNPGVSSAVLVIREANASTLAILEGTGLTTDTWTISPNALVFPDMHWQTTSPPRSFTIQNIGPVPTAGAPAVTLGGTSPADFTIVSETCSSGVLAPGASCSVDVTFKPTTVGPRSANVLVTDALVGQRVGALAGFGLGGTAPGLSISPTSHDYGTIRLVARSLPTRFTLTNGSAMATSGATAILVGASASQFTVIADYCTSTTIPPGGSCDIWVDFHPTNLTALSVTASLQVLDPQLAMVEILLSGFASSGGGNFGVTPDTIDFGATSGAGVRQQLTVTNNRAITSPPIATSVEGIDPGAYRIVNDTCAGAMLPMDATCTLEVETLCAAPGVPQYASLRIVGGGDLTIPVKGTVTATACP